MSKNGYYRFPDVKDEKVVFVSEDDLWQVNKKGGVARRLTANLSGIMFPRLSPNGKKVVFAAQEEGHLELYLMDSDGGKQERLTYLGAMSKPLAWSEDGKFVYFTSNFEHHARDSYLYKVSVEGGEPVNLGIGTGTDISFGKNRCIIGRHTGDPARWKRYRGGTAGEFWMEKDESGTFERFLADYANISNPMWIEDKIYFISDHEGIGNIYSCNLNGKDMERHTNHREFYARFASTDGKTIVYHAGADIYAFDIKSKQSRKIEINYHSSQTQTNRKFVNAEKYLQGYDLHPDGTHTAVAVRGKTVTLQNWSGSVIQRGEKNGVRYRLPTWLQDKKHIVSTSDEKNGEDRLLLINTETGKESLLEKIEVGRIHYIAPSPQENKIAVINHRNEIIIVDIDKKTKTEVDKSKYMRPYSISWSPDGRWLTYDFDNTKSTCVIKVYNLDKDKKYQITKPIKDDYAPVFSDDGKYIYFIGNRILNPVVDTIQFEISFIKTTKLYAVTLKKEYDSPFKEKAKSPAGQEDSKKGKNKKDNDKEKDVKVEIDFENIFDRVIEFPIKAGLYREIQTHKNKIIYQEHPRDCLKDDTNWMTTIPPAKDKLKVYDLEKQQSEELISGISSFKLSLKGDNTIVRKKGKLFVYKTGEKPKPQKKVKKKFSLEDGAIKMSRIRICINPVAEWEQMYREAWLLQREHFWNENMSKIDWEKIYKRYKPLLKRVHTRGEFSDLVWEMQGELGTSHCYELMGDYREHPNYRLGKLGCKYKLSENGEYYIFDKIYAGEATNKNEISPLLKSGKMIEEGDHLLAINKTKVDKETSPRALLLNLAGETVTLTVRKQHEKESREVEVETLKMESLLLYRNWVEQNREYVHKKSNGKIGYIHIPDMGMRGFAEFHRTFLAEYRFDALLVDVRFNGGGFVSQLLLEKLNRDIIAYVKTRWSQEKSYPYEAVAGPMVALTNEFAGSDGDIFSHNFKLMKLGKLIGKRTWGGVVGINGQYSLVDGTITTQPEYAYWFKDVGWKVENYGTDPDIEVEIKPQDYVRGVDPQLDKAIAVLQEELEKNPPVKPKLDNRPDLSLPDLPENDS